MNAVMYILLAPTEPRMSTGKAAAQAAHAAVEAYRLTDPDSNLHNDWYVANHYTKIVLAAPDGPQGLFVAKQYLEERGVKCALIIDEGRTEFDGELTPTAIGCALVNKDNPHIQETFAPFKLYRDPSAAFDFKKVSEAEAKLIRKKLKETYKTQRRWPWRR
jgi:peptidyl-tRNA hydrolase